MTDTLQINSTKCLKNKTCLLFENFTSFCWEQKKNKRFGQQHAGFWSCNSPKEKSADSSYFKTQNSYFVCVFVYATT